MSPPRPMAAIAAATAAGLLSAGCGLVGGGDDGYTVTVYFERAVSVFESSDVRVLGLPAGTVEEIEIEADLVRIDLSIDEGVRLPADVHATIVPQSLIGERYVQLMPAWTEADGEDNLAGDNHVIPVERTIIPVEPDEALGALNEFLQALDPDGLGRLIDNAASALEGNGATLNSALENVSQLVGTFAERDAELGRIIENFDVLTRTLVTREAQLGEVLDSFAAATSVLAQEREQLEAFLAALADLSEAGLDLVSEHAASLRTDLDTLARLAQSIVVNLDSVTLLLDSGPLLVDGLAGAYNHELRAMNLRNNFGPLAQQALNPILRLLLGDPDFSLPCIPIDTVCEGVVGLGAGDAVPVAVPPARTPVDDILTLLAAPSVPTEQGEAGRGRSAAEHVAGGAGAFGRFLRSAAETITGTGG